MLCNHEGQVVVDLENHSVYCSGCGEQINALDKQN